MLKRRPYLTWVFGLGVASLALITHTALTSRTLHAENSRFAVRVFNCDDSCRVSLDGQAIASVGFGRDSGWIDITWRLQPQGSEVLFECVNIAGAITYGFEVRVDDSVVWRQVCGTVGVMGCDNNVPQPPGVARQFRLPLPGPGAQGGKITRNAGGPGAAIEVSQKEAVDMANRWLRAVASGDSAGVFRLSDVPFTWFETTVTSGPELERVFIMWLATEKQQKQHFQEVTTLLGAANSSCRAATIPVRAWRSTAESNALDICVRTQWPPKVVAVRLAARDCSLTGTWSVDQCVCGCGPAQLNQIGDSITGTWFTPAGQRPPICVPITGTRSGMNAVLVFPQALGPTDGVNVNVMINSACNSMSGTWSRAATGQMQPIHFFR